MLSVAEIIQNGSLFDYIDYHAKFRIGSQLRCIDIHSIKQIFIGEYASIKRAIDEKTPLQWLLDIGESYKGEFYLIASLSLSWKFKMNECYIGNLWIQPDYRGNGLSTLIFNEIIDYADELGIVLTLHAIPFISPEKKPTEKDVSKLAEYYNRFGFKRDPDSNGICFNSRMVRLPHERGNDYN
ncbi:MAG: GNAT family N-acetyltransferase [Candidatus Hodarchaeales archaeon]|jgi:GNAT superfamily N-acetyltransferase